VSSSPVDLRISYIVRDQTGANASGYDWSGNPVKITADPPTISRELDFSIKWDNAPPGSYSFLVAVTGQAVRKEVVGNFQIN